MKNIISLYLALACCTFWATNSYAQKLVEGTITKEAIIDDLDSYRDIINKNHINPYTVIKKKTFYDKIEELKDNGKKYDIDELYVKWLQVNAMIQDEHTGIQNISRDMFPFALHWYDEGIFIIATNDENRKCYHGRITAINGMPIDEVIRKIATILADTNAAAIRHQAPHYLTDPFILHGLKISTERKDVVYTVLTPQQETLQISPVTIDKRDANTLTGFRKDNFLRSSVSGRYWFRHFDTAGLVYFQYARCQDDGKFEHVIAELEKTIDEKHPKKLIIDLRYNGGGNSKLLHPFIDYLATSSINSKGKIYVLIGRQTYSSAVLNVLTLKRKTRAIFLGEETGGSVDHFGDTKNTTLAATKLKVYYSTKFFRSDENYTGSLIPDVRIMETFADYDKNIDAVVDYAIAH